MTMLYKVSSGLNKENNYGINLARAIGFPEPLLQKAEFVAGALRAQAESKKQNSEARKLAARRKLVLNMYEALVQAKNSNMDDDALSIYLGRLQTEFVDRMDQLEDGDKVSSEARPSPDYDKELSPTLPKIDFKGKGRAIEISDEDEDELGSA